MPSMRRNRALRRGRFIFVIAAGGIGYILGSWNLAGVRGADATAAQTVALRFPANWGEPAVTLAMASDRTTTAGVVGQVQAALFAPEPMVSHAKTVAPAPIQSAAAQAADATPNRAAPPPVRRQLASAGGVQPVSETKATTAAANHHANRPGYMLDDAQIASIKQRLHLTPDQEQMWPAVAAALRNIGYAKARDAQRPSASANTQLASVDPNSSEVQDLKSAAIPMIMSFNDEQKDEVRNLAHVMGLDQLASQF